MTICVYRYLPTFLSSFSYVPDLLYWVDYLCLSSFTDLFVKFFVCTRFTVLSWLFVFIVIYRSFCQVFSYVPDLLLSWLFVFIVIYRPFCQVFVCTRLTALRWLFVFIVIYRSFVKFFVFTRLTVLGWLFVFIVIYRPFCQVFRMYQTYCVELAICVYRHLPIFLSSFSYVPDLLRVELTICVYRHLPTFLSSFSYVPDLLPNSQLNAVSLVHTKNLTKRSVNDDKHK